ncbi:MAG: hypothetical protein ACPG89_05860 [Schleiferiaceae bacterium]
MKALPLYLALFLSTTIVAQSSSNLRRVQREAEKVIDLTSTLIDGVTTYEKAKKMRPVIQEQFDTWRKAKRTFARLDEEPEQALLDVVYTQLGDIVEASSGPLKDWLEEDPRGSYNYQYLSLCRTGIEKIYEAMETYATTYEINTRKSDVQERFEAQVALMQYTADMNAGAAPVDSIVAFIKAEIGTADIDKLFSAQKSLIKALSVQLRGYGDEAFYEGDGDLYYAYQKYYEELLELATADLLADFTKMKYDLVELRSIARSTEASAEKTLSFFDNEKRLLAKREARFVKHNLPKAPKK